MKRVKKSKEILSNDFLEEKARDFGLRIINTASGDLYVEGPADRVAEFRGQFEEAQRAAIKDFNQSGIQPVEYKVLVLPDQVKEKTAGGIYLPEKPREMEELAQVKAVFIAKGANAFEDWKDPGPRVGDRVYVAKYAGIRVLGADGRQYVICNDKDVAGIITKE